jgi:hypothetical protein
MDNQNNNPIGTNDTNTNLSNNVPNNGQNPTDNSVNNWGAPTFETIPENNLNAPAQTPPENPIETLEADIEPVMVQTNVQTDNFNRVPEPPSFDNSNAKKGQKANKILIIILILIIIGGIGYGVYYYLTMAKESAPTQSFVLKDVIVELGDTLSSDIDDYATITGYDKSVCSLDITEVDSDKIGTYTFYVECSEDRKSGVVIVDDTTSPKAIVNDLTVLPNSSIDAEDFIDSCIDASSCTYEFEDSDMVETYLTTIGEYEVNIIVSDEYQNTTTVTAKLIVSNNAPVKYLTCTSSLSDISDISASLSTTYKIGVSSSNAFYNATKKSNFIFDTLNEYNDNVNNYDESVGINNITGSANFDESTKTITISKELTLSEFNTDLSVNLADDINTIEMYLKILGYTCE